MLSKIFSVKQCFFRWYFILLFLFFFSCKKFVEIDPPKTQITTPTVYNDDATATAAIRGIYSKMSENVGMFTGNLSWYGGLAGDELINYSTSSDVIQFYSNSLSSTNSIIKGLWQEGYQYIYFCNSILEGLRNSGSVSLATKSQLEGETKFVRAFSYFLLLNIFGDIPLVISSDYRDNAVLFRSSKEQVYEQIISDLKDAESLLSESYITPEKVRPNKWAATALLANVYLFNSDWKNSEIESSNLLNSKVYNLEKNIDNVFLKASNETIWQLMPVRPGVNAGEGNLFVLTATPSSVSLSDVIVSSFELGDLRKDKWINSITISSKKYYFPFKYKVQTATNVSEYNIIFRLSEQYLIRAEARAKQNNLADAISDINVIRKRSNLPELQGSLSQSQILAAIIQERKVELFSEFGHRWFDLSRWKIADSVLGVLKAPNWQPTDILFPIPQIELQNDPNLIQNPGY